MALETLALYAVGAGAAVLLRRWWERSFGTPRNTSDLPQLHLVPSRPPVEPVQLPTERPVSGGQAGGG